MGYNISSGRTGGGGGGSTGVTLTSVRVIDIILDESHPRWKELGGWDSLGTIFYTGVTETTSTTKPDKNNAARPLYPNIKQYPLKNEIVIILKGANKDIYGLNKDQDTYYLPTGGINIWSHQHHNALPTKASLEGESGESTIQDYQATENGMTRQVTDGSSDINLGNYFKEQLNVKPLLPYEGDYIIEGRYGNSIRFGASVKDDVIPENNKNDWSQGIEEIGTPITIIRNGQSKELDDKGWVPTIEDINRDDSSIYMTSNQKISSLAVASTNFQSYLSEIILPTDPLIQLTDPPLPEIKQPETPIKPTEEEIEEETTQQDNEDTPPTPEVEEETLVEEPAEETDSLSFFDEMTESGQASEDDFVEYQLIHENTVVGGTEEDPVVESDPSNIPDPVSTPNNEGAEKHEQENKDIKEGKKSKGYPYTLTNKHGKEITMAAPKSWSQLSKNLGPTSSRITKLFIHTTAGNINDSAVDVMNYFFHGRKWGTGGYHFLIEKSGKVTQVYKDNQVTNGVKGQNSESVHFSWIGGYDFKEGSNQMSKGQAITLVDMVKFYCKRYPDIEVFGHNQVAQKSCPWFFVPKFMTELGLVKNRGITNPQWQLNMNALPEYQKVGQQIATGEYPFKNLT